MVVLIKNNFNDFYEINVIEIQENHPTNSCHQNLFFIYLL